jgi:Uma2 family endonuclease
MLERMRVLLLEPDKEWLEERRRRGIDRKDEVWDGVLHVAPEPTTWHQRLATRLAEVLGPLARSRGFESIIELSILDPLGHDRNYRTPDLVVVAPDVLIRRGTEGPVELAIEVLSPNDESRDKMPFYAARGVKELWLVEPETRAIEVYVLRGGTYFAILAEPDARVRAPALGLELQVVDGPKLRITSATDSAEI